MIKFNENDDFLTDVKELVKKKLEDKGQRLRDFSLYVWGINQNRDEDLAVCDESLQYGLSKFIDDVDIIVRNPTNEDDALGISHDLRKNTKLAADIVIFAALFKQLEEVKR